MRAWFGIVIMALVCVWSEGCYRAEHSNPLDGSGSRLLAETPSLARPNGAEQWYVGMVQQIIWGTGHQPADSTVSLWLSIDDGQTYPYKIADHLPNQGAYAWQVPDLPSKRCRVQIVSETARDGSDESFSILREPVPQQMTTGGGEWPSWRGDRLAFMSNRTGNYDIWVLSIEGRQLVQITTRPEFDGYPAWDKKGYRLAFTSSRTGQHEIWASSLFLDNRPEQVQVTTTGGEQPSWQPFPSGQRLAYISHQFGQSDIATIEFSPSLSLSSTITEPRLLTDDGGKMKPTWIIRSSDNANLIYFQTIRQSTGSTEVQTIRADAGFFPLPSTIRLPFTSPVRHPAVSPSGAKLAVSVDGDIWVVSLVNIREAVPLQITFDPAEDDFPDWKMDSSLAFQSNRTGQWEIWTVRLP